MPPFFFRSRFRHAFFYTHATSSQSPSEGDDRLSWTAEGKSPSKSPLNPTKNTPSQIAVLDEGDAIVLSEENGKFMKFKLKGKKLNGLWVAMQQEGAKIWNFQKSELPQPGSFK